AQAPSRRKKSSFRSLAMVSSCQRAEKVENAAIISFAHKMAREGKELPWDQNFPKKGNFVMMSYDRKAHIG
ncbi:MAG: hypothetical protein WCH75_13685, partial [Candidatus Binatia bacterium]